MWPQRNLVTGQIIRAFDFSRPGNAFAYATGIEIYIDGPRSGEWEWLSKVQQFTALVAVVLRKNPDAVSAGDSDPDQAWAGRHWSISRLRRGWSRRRKPSWRATHLRCVARHVRDQQPRKMIVSDGVASQTNGRHSRAASSTRLPASSKRMPGPGRIKCYHPHRVR